MNQIYPNEGLLPMLKTLVDNLGEGLTWQLFTNDVDPSPTTALDDYVLADEAWASAVLVSTDFTFEQVSANVGIIQAENLVFTNNTGDTVFVYGYVIYDADTATIRAAARFDDAPREVLDDGTVTVIPILASFSEATAV